MTGISKATRQNVEDAILELLSQGDFHTTREILERLKDVRLGVPLSSIRLGRLLGDMKRKGLLVNGHKCRRVNTYYKTWGIPNGS